MNDYQTWRCDRDHYVLGPREHVPTTCLRCEAEGHQPKHWHRAVDGEQQAAKFLAPAVAWIETRSWSS